METKASIPGTTIETLARNFFKEASTYGFKQDDYLRYINILLDFSMNHMAGKMETVKLEMLQKKNQPISNREICL